MHWWLVAVAALVLGAGYGCCLVCGLTEVRRTVGAENLGGLTAVFRALVCPGSLTVVPAVLTLAGTTYRAAHGPDPAQRRNATTSGSGAGGAAGACQASRAANAS